MKENAKENELVKKLTNKHYTITTLNHVPRFTIGNNY